MTEILKGNLNMSTDPDMDTNQYEKSIDRLNELIDEVGVDEQHPLYDLLDTLGTVIHAYEEKHHLCLTVTALTCSNS